MSSSWWGLILGWSPHRRWQRWSRAVSLPRAHTSQNSRRMVCIVCSLIGTGCSRSLTTNRCRKISGSCALSERVKPFAMRGRTRQNDLSSFFERRCRAYVHVMCMAQGLEREATKCWEGVKGRYSSFRLWAMARRVFSDMIERSSGRNFMINSTSWKAQRDKWTSVQNSTHHSIFYQWCFVVSLWLHDGMGAGSQPEEPQKALQLTAFLRRQINTYTHLTAQVLSQTVL